jgi:hypothetical protein
MTSADEQPEPAPDTQPQPAQQASVSRARLWFYVVPSVLALIVVSGVLVYLVVGGQSHPAASSTHPAASSTHPASTSTSASPALRSKPAIIIPPGGETGSAALASLGSTALPLPKQFRAPVEAWYASRGGTELTAVSGALGVVTQAAGVREYVEMNAGCARLAAGVRAAQAGPPIPDAALQTLYATALAELADGAAACRAAIAEQPDGDEYIVTTENQLELHRAASAFTAGARDLYRATAEIEAISRRG